MGQHEAFGLAGGVGRPTARCASASRNLFIEPCASRFDPDEWMRERTLKRAESLEADTPSSTYASFSVSSRPRVLDEGS